jgi:hypothetical protein
MAEDRHPLSDRLRDFLVNRYRGPGAEKRLAQDINCDPRTARNHLLGHWPNPRHLSAMIRRFGRDFNALVFDAELDDIATRIELAIREREGELEDLKAQLRAVAPVLPDPPRNHHSLVSAKTSRQERAS